jgi:hypothetical protein
MKEKKEMELELVRVLFTILMALATRESSETIFAMVLEYSSSTKSKSTEESGQGTKSQAKGKLEISQS